MARVEKLPQYRTNLDDIWFFIAQDSVANADRFIDRIEETVSRIA
jgi:plasmid stabilization system protein ParE